MHTILITGGAGFIGSHLAERLVEDNEVIFLDNLDSYYDTKIKEKNVEYLVSKGCRFIKGDITDYALVRDVLREVDIVFHQAARPGVRYSIEDPFTPNAVNVAGILNVLKASAEHGVKKVINASSSSVYGIAKYLPIDEEHPTQPISPYGVSKLAAEHYCRVFYELYGLKTVSLRYFTVYGPRMRPDLAIPKFTTALLSNQQPTVFGDGEQTRDFTYIDDVVAANLRTLETSAGDGEAINIGSGRRVTINHLITLLKDITGAEVSSRHTARMMGEARDTLANIAKAKRLLGYSPKVSLEDGLARFVNWFKDNACFYSAK